LCPFLSSSWPAFMFFMNSFNCSVKCLQCSIHVQSGFWHHLLYILCVGDVINSVS
jgi:hypothetical protein